MLLSSLASAFCYRPSCCTVDVFQALASFLYTFTKLNDRRIPIWRWTRECSRMHRVAMVIACSGRSNDSGPRSRALGGGAKFPASSSDGDRSIRPFVCGNPTSCRRLTPVKRLEKRRRPPAERTTDEEGRSPCIASRRPPKHNSGKLFIDRISDHLFRS